MHSRTRLHTLTEIEPANRPMAKKRIFKIGTRILILAACLFLLKQGHALFTVKEIRIDGPAHIEREAVLETSGIKKNASIFLVRARRAAERLLLEPAVLKADVSRVYPSTIVITLSGRAPSASILAGGECWIVDGEGIVYERGAEIGGNLPVVTGVEPEQLALGSPLKDPAHAKALKAFVGALAAVPDLETSELNLADCEEMILYTASGIKVLLGDSDRLQRKLTLVRETLPYLSETNGSCLDVRTGDRLVVMDRP